MILVREVQDLGYANQFVGLEPGTEAHTRAITATKIPAILGVDAYGNTRYTLWHQLAGNYTPTFAGNSATRRGTHLEAGIAGWWAEEHGRSMEWAGTWRSRENDGWFATPDYFVSGENGPEILEVKTSARMDGFGAPDRGVIPANYWAQIAWQSLITGVRTVNLTVLGGFLERTDYTFHFENFELESLAEEVTGFTDTLPGAPEEWSPLPLDPIHDWEAALAVTPVTSKTVDVADLYSRYAAAKVAGAGYDKEADSLRKEIITASAGAEVAVAGEVTVAKRTEKGAFRFSPVKPKSADN